MLFDLFLALVHSSIDPTAMASFNSILLLFPNMNDFTFDFLMYKLIDGFPAIDKLFSCNKSLAWWLFRSVRLMTTTKSMWAPFLSVLLCKSLNNNDCKWTNDSMNYVILLTWSKSEVNFMQSQIISHFSWADHKRFPVQFHWFQQELKKEEARKKHQHFEILGRKK